MEEAGHKVPLLNQIPVVHSLAHPFWEAFEILNVRRLVIDDRIQPIQISELRSYADLLGIVDADDRADLLYYVGTLDQMFLSDAYQKKAVEDKKANQRAKRGAKRSTPARRR